MSFFFFFFNMIYVFSSVLFWKQINAFLTCSARTKLKLQQSWILFPFIVFYQSLQTILILSLLEWSLLPKFDNMMFLSCCELYCQSCNSNSQLVLCPNWQEICLRSYVLTRHKEVWLHSDSSRVREWVSIVRWKFSLFSC